jgi:hypothetical protein
MASTTSRVRSERRDERGFVSKRALVMVLAALVIFGMGGALGGAAGYKIEQRRVKDELSSKRALDVATSEQQLNFELKNVRPVGRVTEVRDGSFRVTLLTATGHRDFTLTEGTVFGRVGAASRADLRSGALVVVDVGGSRVGELTAREVIVLPDGSVFGQRRR